MDNKKGLSIVLCIAFALIGLCVGFFIGKNTVNKEEKIHMYLPVYEYNSAVDGSAVLNNDYENISSKQKLNKLVKCQYDYCKWVYSGYSTYTDEAWVMYDVSAGDVPEGGYYFYNHSKDKVIAGPFTDIEFEKPLSKSDISRKVIVSKENGYGLYDLEDMKYILELDCDDMLFGEDSNHVEVYNNQDNKIITYLIEGDSYMLVGEEAIPEGEA